MYKRIVKRLLDFTLAGFLIILLSPVLLIAALLIKVESPGKIIFRQQRIGYCGNVFTIYKFRSMKENSEHTGNGAYCEKGDERLTRVGSFLRATSIDELPQLVNIIRGEMSFIGPRPPLTYHPWAFDEYTDEQKRMFEVRPGITGWAQVHGRKNVEWHERIKMNIWYVDHLSFGLDTKIFFMTIFKVIVNADNKNNGKTVAQELSGE